MPRITKVYTRKGDDGTTALGDGERVDKDALRVEAYGTVDECNAFIGAALARGVDESLAEDLRRIQNELFHLGAELCVPGEDDDRSPGPRIERRHIEALETLIDRLDADLGPLENFILPGGGPGAAQLQVARAVCRRAERLVVALSRREAVSPLAVEYLNRLSDALFTLARAENARKGVAETCWDSRA